MRKKIVALILEKDGLFLVEKRKNTALRDPESIVFPGGHVHDNESLNKALKRETMEELGIELIEPKLIHIAEYDYPTEKQKLYWYWCNRFSGIIQNNVAEELIWIKPFESHKLTYQAGKDALSALLKQK